MHDEEIETALLENPSIDGFSVYGDWFIQRGHPRGELIALQVEHARARQSGDKRRAQGARDRGRAHLERHGDELGRPMQDVEPQWYCGFWQTVTIEADTVDLAAVLAHPSARLLRSIRVRSAELTDCATLTRNADPELAVRPATLDGIARLVRADRDARAWRPAMSALTRLRLGAASLVLVDRPIGEMNAHAIASIYGLASLYLNARVSWGDSIRKEALRALEPLASSLSILAASTCATLDDTTCAMLAKFTRLEELHIAYTAITSAGLDHLARLPNLRLLDVRGCDIGDTIMFPSLKTFRR